MTTSRLMPLALLIAPLASCGEKQVEEAPPPVGWFAEELWKGECYFPPNFDDVEAAEGTSARRMARQEALEAMKMQWSGGKDDGVSLDSGAIEDLDTILLGDPGKIEEVTQRNLEQCKQVMGAGGSTDAWNSWLRGLPAVLTAGECPTPPHRNTLFDYLDIGYGWQIPVSMCEGDTAIITGTLNDKYRVSDDGDWITVEGVPGAPAMGDDYLCTTENCLEGMLIGRYVTEDGYEEIFPIGAEASYTATRHGTLTVTINDTTYFDNKYFSNGGIDDHTGITISAPE